MRFEPFVYDKSNQKIPATISAMTQEDAKKQTQTRYGKLPGPVNT